MLTGHANCWPCAPGCIGLADEPVDRPPLQHATGTETITQSSSPRSRSTRSRTQRRHRLTHPQIAQRLRHPRRLTRHCPDPHHPAPENPCPCCAVPLCARSDPQRLARRRQPTDLLHPRRPPDHLLRNAFTTRLGLPADERRLLRDPTPLDTPWTLTPASTSTPTIDYRNIQSLRPTCLPSRHPAGTRIDEPAAGRCSQNDSCCSRPAPACQAPYTSPRLALSRWAWRCTARTSAMSGPGAARPWCGHDLRITCW